MNTKTMRLPPRRSFLTPTKRKDRDGFINSVKPSITSTTTSTTIPFKLPKPTNEPPPPPIIEPAKSNQLLAGYLAHEFLSKGTLFGQTFDPAATRAEIVAKKKEKKVMMSSQKAEPSRGKGRVEPGDDKCERYVEISGLLLKSEGTHIQGIVNPTQLARFLQM